MGEEVVRLADEGVYELLADMESIYMETNEFNKESIFEVSFSKEQQNWKTRYFGTVDGGMCRGEIYTTHFNPTPDLRDAYALIDGNPISSDANSLYDAAAYWKTEILALISHSIHRWMSLLTEQPANRLFILWIGF